MIALIVSKKDIAGMNFRKLFIENFSFKETSKEFDGNKVFSHKNFELFTIEKEQIFADYVNEIDADLIVFASKHRSEKGIPTLTVHPIGNFGKAEMGGKDETLVPTDALIMKSYLLELQSQKLQKNLSYEVSFECIHHGPFLAKPTVFIELGSSEKQWVDVNAAESICQTIINKTFAPKEKQIVCIGIGGGHYCAAFTRLALKTNYSFSGVIPKYALQHFSQEILQKMLSASFQPVQEIVLDYKGLGQFKEKVKAVLEKQALPVIRDNKIEK